METIPASAGRTEGLGRDPRLLVVYLGAGVLALCLLINYELQRHVHWSIMWPFLTWLHGGYRSDSWGPMLEALEWIRHHPGGGVYRAIFFGEGSKFQYAPTSLLPLVAVKALGITPTIGHLNRINQPLMGLTAIGVGVLTWVLLEDAASRRTRAAAAGLMLAATLLFYPVVYGYHLGQLQVWLTMLFVFACIAWARNARAEAGVLIGLICLLKPQFALFVVWGVIRRERRFLVAIAATGVIGVAMSVALFGFRNHLEYFEVLGYLSRHGESFWANQSVNGILNRLLVDKHPDVWSQHGFPAFHPVVYAGTLLTSLAIIAVALFRPRPTTPRASLLDFELAALAFTMASPIAWEHHYGVLAPIFATLFADLLAASPDGGRAHRGELVVLAVCFLFSANCFQFTSSWSTPSLILLQSYLFLAGLGVMVMTWRFAKAPPSARPPP